jgi:AraC-like DNA-binding protein
MSYLFGSIDRPVRFYSAGIFKSRVKNYKHATRVINSFELILGLNNTIYMGEEGMEYAVGPGDALILYPGISHYGYRFSDMDPMFFWCHFTFREEPAFYTDINLIPGITHLTKNPFHSLFQDRVILPKYYRQLQNERLPVLCREIMHINDSKYYTEQAVNLHMTSLLVELSNQFLKDVMIEANMDTTEILLARMLDCIKLNYMKDYTIRHIGQELEYNTDYLARIFRERMGMKVANYINYMRIRKAKKLLLETILSIKEISYEVGYHDEKYFMNLFRRFENITPTEYRKSYYKMHYNTD